MRHEPAQERQVRGHAADLGPGERLAEKIERLVARLAVGDQLREQRVVREGHLVALLDSRVDADAVGKAQPLDPPALRKKASRVLGVQANLDRMPLCYHVNMMG